MDKTSIVQGKSLVRFEDGPKSIVQAAVSKLSSQEVLRLGVTGKYLTKVVQEIGLSQVELQDLLVIRLEHDGHIPTAVKLMVKRGMNVEDVCQLFRLREAVCSTLGDEKKTISFPILCQCLDIFKDLDPDDEDGTGERLFDAIGEVKRRMFYLLPSQALEVICQAAKARGLHTLEAAVDAVLENQPLKEVWKPDPNYYNSKAKLGDKSSPGIIVPLDEEGESVVEPMAPSPLGKARRIGT